MMPNAQIPLYGGNYNGLKRYSDTTDPDSVERQNLMGFEGPNIIIALEKEQDDLFSDTAPQPAGQFQLTEAAANDVIGAIAKGEVYFKRAIDVGYFNRGDGFEERENAFSPYWQARLAPLSHADRVVATLQQQNANFDSTSMTPFSTLSWNLLNWVP